jgi:predicted ATP pyrophosphatase (TIGR00289 family)
MRVAALVSGGKDSALALHRVLEQGYDVKFLVTMLPQREDSWMFHSLNIGLMDLFSEAVGIPLVKAKTEGVKEKELEDLKRLLATVDVDGVVSGAISSRYQKSRIDRICQQLNLKSIAPLWQEEPIRLLKELIHLDFTVMITGVYAHGFNSNWLGRKIDASAVNDLIQLYQKYKVSPVGEGGEYETLVLDAFFFKKRIRVVEVEKRWRDYMGYMHVKKAELVDK